MTRPHSLSNGFMLSILLHAGIFLFFYLLSAHRDADKAPVYYEIAEFKLEKPLLQSEVKPVQSVVKEVSPPAAKSAAKQEKIAPLKVPEKPAEEKSAAEKPAVLIQPSSPSLSSDQGLKQDQTAKTDQGLSEASPSQASPVPTPQVENRTPAKPADAQNAQSAAINNASGDSKGGWGAYGRSLSQACLKFKRYPASAAASHWQGLAYVLVHVNGDGSVELKLRRSSGIDVLDNEALRMVDQALKVTPIPESLRNKSNELIIPISFSM